MNNKCNLISCDLLLFATNLISFIACGFILFYRNLFKLIVRGLLNCFARILLNAPIKLIFIIRIYLTICLIPIFFSLKNYTVNINGNVQNFFKIYRALLQICNIYIRFFTKTVNMCLRVLVYSTHFFYLRFVYFHNFFHLTDGHILWCARAFISWMQEVFTAFMHTNMTITWFFFIFRRARCIFLTLIIIHTWISIHN